MPIRGDLKRSFKRAGGQISARNCVKILLEQTARLGGLTAVTLVTVPFCNASREDSFLDCRTGRDHAGNLRSISRLPIAKTKGVGDSIDIDEDSIRPVNFNGPLRGILDPNVDCSDFWRNISQLIETSAKLLYG